MEERSKPKEPTPHKQKDPDPPKQVPANQSAPGVQPKNTPTGRDAPPSGAIR